MNKKELDQAINQFICGYTCEFAKADLLFTKPVKPQINKLKTTNLRKEQNNEPRRIKPSN